MSSLAVSRRELDALLIFGIILLALYLVFTLLGGPADFAGIRALVARYLGFATPIFVLAGGFLLWVTAALLLEVVGISNLPRDWSRIGATLFYLENAGPYIGLLECFASIIRALSAYSEAGATNTAQQIVTSNIANALAASAIGCLVALLAHTLNAVITFRSASK